MFCDSMDDISAKITEQNGELVMYIDNLHSAIQYVVNRYEYAMFFLWDIELVFKDTKKPIGKQRLHKLFKDAVMIPRPNSDVIFKLFESYWNKEKHHTNKEYRSKLKLKK